MDNNETGLCTVLGELIEKDFSLSGKNLPVNTGLEEYLRLLKEELSKKVSVLMEKDFDQFANTLYRIDLPEDKVTTAFNDKAGEGVNDKLADLIIERELMRARTRLLYKQGKL